MTWPRFSLDGEDPTIKKYEVYARRIQAALLQEKGQPAPLEEQVWNGAVLMLPYTGVAVIVLVHGRGVPRCTSVSLWCMHLQQPMLALP
jgi:hypothetical protein